MNKHYATVSLAFELRYKEHVIDISICDSIIKDADLVVDLVDCVSMAIARGFDYAGIVCKNINDLYDSYLITDDIDLMNKFDEIKDCVNIINTKYIIKQIREENE